MRTRMSQILRLLCMSKEPVTFHTIYSRLEHCTGRDVSYIGVYNDLRSLCRVAFALEISVAGDKTPHYTITEFGRAAAQTYSHA